MWCKNAIQILSPNDKKIQAQKAQYDEFVESGLENQVLMSWTVIIMDPGDPKVKVD